MIRFALGFVRDHATAEEVVQEAWLGVLRGLATFEGRSSLRSSIFAIVANRAKTRAVRETRSTPFSALAAQEASGTEPAGLRPWPLSPFGLAMARALGTAAGILGRESGSPSVTGRNHGADLRGSSTSLPRAQRAVVTLRDVAGHSSESVCNILRHHRDQHAGPVLHRGRSKTRGELERYFSDFPSDARSAP